MLIPFLFIFCYFVLTVGNVNAFAPSKHSTFANHRHYPCQQRNISPTKTKGFKELNALNESFLLDSNTSSSSFDFVEFSLSLASNNILSNENIKIAFNMATFGPQILWLFMILIPNAKITKSIMGGYGAIVTFSLVHLFIVVASASQDQGTAPLVEFNDVFNPAGDPQAAMVGMMKYPNFVSEEWSHVLTWDLFVGRSIWLDGIKRGIFTSHSVLLCNLIGPPGYLLHCATCILTGKGIETGGLTDDE